MRYLEPKEALNLYQSVIARHGGARGVRDVGALESALAQPMATFGGVDLYQSVAEKGVALAYSIIKNHPFVDGNKRVGHLAMETFFMLNGFEIGATTEEQEKIILSLAQGSLDREGSLSWVNKHLMEASK